MIRSTVNLLLVIAGIVMFTQSQSAQAAMISKLRVNGVESATLEAGRPALLEFEFIDSETGARVKDFKSMHKKYMHLVIVREDLGEFHHVHPVFDAGSGLFQIAMNLPYFDPDNFDTAQALSLPGRYYLITEVQRVMSGIKSHTHDFTVVGNSDATPLVEDEKSPEGGYVKYFDENGSPSTLGAAYEVTLTQTATVGCGGHLVEIRFTVKMQSESGIYEEIFDFEPWLMMGGHAIAMGQQGQLADEKVFVHLHAAMPDEGSTFMFSTFDRGKLREDLYRIWGQFKRGGHVLTLPFTIRYTPPAETADDCGGR